MIADFDMQSSRQGKGFIKWDRYGDPEVLGMGVADMDFPAAPCVVRALTEVAQQGYYNYHYKSADYFNTIINWYQRRYKVAVKQEWLSNTPGTWPAVRLSLQTYTRPGDYVIVQTPHFGTINDVVNSTGCHLLLNPMKLENGRYTLDIADFEAKVREKRPRVYLLVNPHNPTGRVFTETELNALAEICMKYHVLMISDEVHSNIRFDGKQHIPLFALSPEVADNCVVVTSPSKGYNMMDLTYSILIIPNEELHTQYKATIKGFNMNFATNLFGAVGLQAAYSEEADQWLDELNAYLAQNLNYLEQRIREMGRIGFVRPEGGYMAWLDCRALGLTPAQLQTLFQKDAKVGLTWGEGFGTAGEGFERLNFACPRATLEEGLNRIQAVLGRL